MSKIRIDYPVFINPTFVELVELCKNPWDTMRILENDDLFIIGSGYGNTHTTLAHCYAEHNGFKKVIRPELSFPNNITYRGKWPYWDSFILHHKYGKCYINLEDVSGNQYEKLLDAPMCNLHIQYLKDIAELSGLEYV